MNIDWAAIIGKAPEIVSLVIVVYFALQMSADGRKHGDSVMLDWRNWLEAQQKAHRDYCERQESRFIGALSEIREDNTAVISELTAQIQKLTDKTDDISKQMVTVTTILDNLPRSRTSK